MKTREVIFLIIILFCSACNGNLFLTDRDNRLTPSSIYTPNTEDEYKIFSAILKSYVPKGTVALLDERVVLNSNFIDKLNDYSTKIDIAGWDDYILLDNTEIDNNFDIPRKTIQILDSQETWNLIKTEGWISFNENQGNVDGFLTFSQIAFHPYRREAVVYLDVHCGDLCGHGAYYYLNYRFGNWRITEIIPLWIS